MIVDHLIAMSLIGTVGGWMAGNTIRSAFQGFLFVGINGGLLTYWAMRRGMQPGTGPAAPQIYYDADVTPEEKERIEMQDQLNVLAHNMSSRPGYGLIDLNAKYEV